MIAFENGAEAYVNEKLHEMMNEKHKILDEVFDMKNEEVKMLFDDFSKTPVDVMIDKTTTTGGDSSSFTSNSPKMVGWICPVCGRGLSPFTRVCPCQDKLEITY